MDFDPFPLITKWAFFIYLAAPRPTLRLLTRRQPHLPNVIIQCTCLTWPKSQREPCNEVGSQSPTKLINGIRTGTLSIPSEQAIPLSLMSHEEKKQLKRQLQFNSHKFWRVTFFYNFLLSNRFSGILWTIICQDHWLARSNNSPAYSDYCFRPLPLKFNGSEAAKFLGNRP